MSNDNSSFNGFSLLRYVDGVRKFPSCEEWTVSLSESATDRALACTRGSYQRGIVLGYENLSGSLLRGKARLYASRYKVSQANLLQRLTVAGIPHNEIRGKSNRRVLVLG